MFHEMLASVNKRKLPINWELTQLWTVLQLEYNSRNNSTHDIRSLQLVCICCISQDTDSEQVPVADINFKVWKLKEVLKFELQIVCSISFQLAFSRPFSTGSDVMLSYNQCLVVAVWFQLWNVFPFQFQFRFSLFFPFQFRFSFWKFFRFSFWMTKPTY